MISNDEKIIRSQDPFTIAYENFRKKLSASPELSESEWKEYFDISRGGFDKLNQRDPSTSLRSAQDDQI